MKTSLDTVVIGGGAMGSAAAWALASRGRAVTLLEQFSPGHRNGASHGATRNFNPGYADPDYVAMLAEAVRLWDELEADGGERLLARTGVVNHGTDPRLGEVRTALRGAGMRAEFLSAAEAAERWRGIRFDQRVLHMADGGQLNPDAALPAMQRLAAGLGAEIRHHVKVLELKVLDDGVRLTLESGGRTEVLNARQAVVTAGGWTTKLLAGAAPLPRLR
ncbi:MAG TPA: FAD-dependent oxidoreductase, partial [Arthrobacter sp.]|nr:FAD-dependent oxidoreductase [Arthrobacter sp.]